MTFTPHLTLKMTTAKVVETSFYINANSASQDSTNLDDLHPQTSIYLFSFIRILRNKTLAQVSSTLFNKMLSVRSSSQASIIKFV